MTGRRKVCRQPFTRMRSWVRLETDRRTCLSDRFDGQHVSHHIAQWHEEHDICWKKTKEVHKSFCLTVLHCFQVRILWTLHNRAGESCAFSKLHGLWPFPRSLSLRAEGSPRTSLGIHWGQDSMALWNGYQWGQLQRVWMWNLHQPRKNSPLSESHNGIQLTPRQQIEWRLSANFSWLMP